MQMRRTNKFVVAITAMSLAAVGGGIGAAGAQARSEVLSGTVTTTSGSSYCQTGNGARSFSVKFDGAGMGTGPYPGPFSETGSASIQTGSHIAFGIGQLAINFAITSGTTTMSGTITDNRGFAAMPCNGSASFNLPIGGNSATFTGTIRAPGKTPRTIRGTALVSSAKFYVQPGSQTSLTATLWPGPTVATGSASNVGANSATVLGTVNPNGTATTYHFDYGTSTNYGSRAPAPPDPSAGSGTTAQTESTTLTGLTPGTVYHYRIEATNASGTSYGTDQTFTTTA
jgi:hypothetical protein